MARITLYTTQLCGYCRAAKQLLMSKGLDFEEIPVDWDPDLREQMTERAGGQRTVPQIFINERHVGGYQDLATLDRDGKLEDWLDAEPEQASVFAEDSAKV
ncbi:glutaredoxin 3 [Methyloligella solikamskensis]|uniref:Glutaredoxin n=1 Tax=Methyloligella solikamskensis TaxID=1177756 RepID=A0ABW3J7B5_9HYPH